jgi:hypothetical protein
VALDLHQPQAAAHVTVIARIAVVIYLLQAIAGFAIGFTMPFLQFFNAI